eukprot:COSAG05_NODE_2461_length_3032_cov_20.500479_3_plen_67_part_00
MYKDLFRILQLLLQPKYVYAAFTTTECTVLLLLLLRLLLRLLLLVALHKSLLLTGSLVLLLHIVFE